MSDPTPIRPDDDPARNVGAGVGRHWPPGWQPPTQYVYLPQPPTNQSSGMALAAMILGVVGLLISPLSILAVIFGHVALGNIRRTGQPGRGMAWTGLVCGYLVCALWVFVLVFVIATGTAGMEG